MKKVLVLLVIFSILAISFELELRAEERKDYVILLHGMGRTAYSMRKMERFLSSKEYNVINFGYASKENDIEHIAAQLDDVILKECKDTEKKIHFVTHSLGGIVVRFYLKDKKKERIGRVVMLAPPNKGSELADWLKNSAFYEWIVGPSGQQLGTDNDSIPLQLGSIDFELGIIAGDKSLNPLFSSKIPGPDDGKVSVESTKIKGMKDFIVVHSSHTFIMNNDEVQRQVDFFLKNGFFDKKKED